MERELFVPSDDRDCDFFTGTASIEGIRQVSEALDRLVLDSRDDVCGNHVAAAIEHDRLESCPRRLGVGEDFANDDAFDAPAAGDVVGEDTDTETGALDLPEARDISAPGHAA